jgi:hypothetical protein
MGILDDSNPFRGLRPDDATEEERLRSARRIAIGSLVMTMLWGFGFLSLGGLLGGASTLAFIKGRDERLTRHLAQGAVVLGGLGIVLTLVVFGPEILDELLGGPAASP